MHMITVQSVECEWMDTEEGDLLWYEEHVVVDKAKAEEFESTIHQSLSPQWYNECAKHITARMVKDVGQQLTLLTSSHA